MYTQMQPFPGCLTLFASPLAGDGGGVKATPQRDEMQCTTQHRTNTSGCDREQVESDPGSNARREAQGGDGVTWEAR